MSFLKANVPQPKPLFAYLPISGAKGLASGESFFILGVGNVTQADGDYWKNADWTDPTAAVPKMYCSFWMNEKKDEKNKYVRWCYTGPNDPVHVLGLDSKDQDTNKLEVLYGEKAPRFITAQPEIEFIIPALKVNRIGKAYDVDNGEYVMLIARRNQLDSIIEAASRFADQDNSSVYGRVLSITKNLQAKKPADMYNFSILFSDPRNTPDMDRVFQEMRAKAIADIDRVFEEANGGSYDPDNVWGYLVSHFGGSQEEMIRKYTVKPGASTTLSGFEEVAL